MDTGATRRRSSEEIHTGSRTRRRNAGDEPAARPKKPTTRKKPAAEKSTDPKKSVKAGQGKPGTQKPRTAKSTTAKSAAAKPGTGSESATKRIESDAPHSRSPKPGSLREAVSIWANRPVAGVRPQHIGRAVVALLTVAVLVITGFGWSRVNSLNSSVTLLDGLGLGGDSDGALDILLVGTDSRNDAKGNPLSEEELKWLRVGGEVTTSTDTILLIRIPKDGSAATAISIPRDSYVEVPGLGKSKINAAYGATRETVRMREVEAGKDEQTAEREGTKAGRQALIQSVANLTGVGVDHYAEVGLLGFALLTDAVGGVDVCLKRRVNEPYSGARFKAGRQTLTGPKALSFVRQRHGLPRGDLDRITRQQVYMASLAQKILSTQTLTNPNKLQELQNAVSRSVVLDDGWDVLSLAEQLKDLSGGDVKFTTIPVLDDQAWSDDGTQSVIAVDPPAVHAWVDRLLGKASPAEDKPEDPRSGVTVDVVNAGTVDGLASNVSGLLKRRGYEAGDVSSKPMNEFDSIVFAKSTDSEAAKQLVKDLGGGIEIREDSSLPDDRLRAVLTNTYAGAGSIVQTGDQGQGTGDDSQTGAGSTTRKPSSPVIKADGDGPVCVN